MSKRNSQEAKRAARERLRIEREEQAKKEKRRRQLGVGGAVVAVLAIAAGIGIVVTNMSGGGGDGDWSAAQKVAEGEASAGQYTSYEIPANTEGKDGTKVVIGDEDAKNTVTFYEDMRCPACAAFEQANSEGIEKDIEDGKYNAEFVFGAFLDRNLPGDGSKNALSALGAALNVSPEAFLEYKALLYSADVHPEEQGPDEFGEDDYLIDAAQDIKELKGNEEFETAVKDGTYDPWAVNMAKKFDDNEDVTGTPTLMLNGKKLQNAQGNAPATPAEYNKLIDENLKK